ncbi:protein kinase [bacterium]|nr:protein kinase [bacterium]
MNDNSDSPLKDGTGSLSDLPTTDAPPRPQRRIIADRYEIRSKLGKGGMGEVWHAYDLKLRVEVALKSLRVDLKGNHGHAEALRREVRTAREVISPNVCRIFDLVVEEDSELISMEYIDGITLITLLIRKGPLNLREARDIAAQFLAGLEAIHQAGMVHRDLKPENIMITRTGRVVVMDFGVAKELTQLDGTISGTIPYMSPEQMAGERIDVRTDIFSAGVVLAEMIHPDGVISQKTREAIWNTIRKNPMQLPDTPWKGVIVRAVAANALDRFPSAAAVARALEEVTQRIETIEERRPYPGLASFSASEAEYFFGRELEVEMLIKKLQQLHFMALIGPSGTGKTSMLRAGLIPALPLGWSYVLCFPGDAPMVNLAQELASKLSGDAEAFAKMIRFEEPDVSVSILQRWRQRHPEALLIVDRFEELFTLNNSETQSKFAELLGRAVLEADLRVLLTMRDDFLMFCHQQPSLTPVFSELSGLSQLTGAALRRALVQPALKCGYRFEDEALVDEILTDVEKERGALPLMAFAAGRLWEKKERQLGVLTRAAYREIGGVAGALAQHAEATMERIGTERQPVVREIFRNLITAQNTRAARDTEELLSVFPQKNEAEEVLRMLIDARLVTSFEAPAAEGEKPRSRVEIIHESLLSNWPRLVRWQTQDADSAQLRDQLRQAAQLWEQRNRSEDLLWTGGAFLEFQAWRERYSGGLSSVEESFAQAMTIRATRRRRQQRALVTATIIVLLIVLVTIGAFWRSAEVARKDAVLETRRAEAGKLLALGRGELETDPNAALAYSLAATELADTPEGRIFALRALWNGPLASLTELPIRPLSFGDFDPEGKQLVVGGVGGVQLLDLRGSPPLFLSESLSRTGWSAWPQFSPNKDLIIWRSSENLRVITVWSVTQKKVVREFAMEGYTGLLVRGGKAFLTTDMTGQVEKTGKFGQVLVRTWEFDSHEPIVVGQWNREETAAWDIDPKGKLLAFGKGNGVYAISLDRPGTSSGTLLEKHNAEVTAVTFHPDGEQVASADASGEIRIWPVTANSKKERRVFFEKEAALGLYFDHSGSHLAIKAGERSVRIKDLLAPSETESRLLFQAGLDSVFHVAFHPTDPWVAVVGRERLRFYPLDHPYPFFFKGTGQIGSFDIGFTPDGRSLVTAFPLVAPVQLWHVPGEPAHPRRDVGKILEAISRIAIDPVGRYVLVCSGPNTYLLSLQDGTTQVLSELLRGVERSVAFSTDGKLAASAAAIGPPENLGIEIWNLEDKGVRLLDQSKGKSFHSLKFSRDGTVFSGDAEGNVWQWDLRKNTGTVIAKGKGIVFDLDVSGSGRYVVAAVVSAKHLGEFERATWELILYDVSEKKSSSITSHGNRVCSVAFDPGEKRLVTGDREGIVRVGPITDDAPPHLLFGSETPVLNIAVHPNGKWIASAERGRASVRLWSMPSGTPFHTLPRDEFLNRLRALTNVRVVKDNYASTGYRIDLAPFPGWEKIPTW